MLPFPLFLYIVISNYVYNIPLCIPLCIPLYIYHTTAILSYLTPALIVLFNIKNIMFSVGEAPSLKTELENQTVIATESVTLSFTADLGDPTATIKWYKDNKEVYKNKKYTFEVVDEIVSLVIHECSLKDAGAYRCEASNKLGRVETQCSLTVHSKFYNIGLPRTDLAC